MTTPNVLLQSELPLTLLRRGKVREVYVVDAETVLLLTSDRISAFDIVMNEPIPFKGAVLTQMSTYWFKQLESITPSHYITADADEIIDRVPSLKDHRDIITGRAMLARKTEPVSFECVIRGYLSGSAWKEYREKGTLAGEPLAKGLKESDKLAPPIFSPATKAETGHDENVSIEYVENHLGEELTQTLQERSMALYVAGRDQAATCGLIIADTKFEFGHASNGELLLIDEILTPDSSRFWAADDYEPGRGQKSFDKQPLRDYLATLKNAGSWNGEAPPPTLSEKTVNITSERYVNAYRRITGAPLPGSE